MTEQPVETEQQFLGNEAQINDPIVQPAVEPPFLTAIGEKHADLIQPRQHYSPNAHLRRPAWSPVDNVELTALARKSAVANRKLAIAKAESVRAEESLKLALDVENQAAEEVYAANEALVAFTRKDTGL
ncbi:hypothetical protein [Arthrobacter sp. NicSoilC5]|uniref:hypothetical protein n=1 Tax=Arthrobacter sp. NicSoilC5 TaxID=2831000 RepID=UPI001CC518CD|nr:hypothetical protein [Arthrobacter sp. NicSoilC5]BCW78984.1 hypothetical protein NicSoilC5_10030 [Arthrobacter sp. NicSoilC5]